MFCKQTIEILKLCSYFKILYSNKDNATFENVIDSFTQIKNILSDEEIINSEGPISLEECTNFLKGRKTGKSPGSDGFTVEFYNLFWSDIGNVLYRSINYAYSSGKLSDFQRQGIITCIPKGL